jgi:hypothetical protein
MSALRWAGIAVGVVVVGWLGFLVVLDETKARGYGDDVALRVGEPLGATGTMGSTDLALVRGRIALDGLALARDDAGGRLSLGVDELRCDVAPLGYALVDGTCDDLAVVGLHLDASTAAVFHVQHPKHPPVHARHVVIENAVLAFDPDALAPGLGRIEVRVDHADAGDTRFRTPLSWLFALHELDARLALPAGVEVHVRYDGSRLAADGSLLGSDPIEVDVTLPPAGTLEDGKAEMRALVQVGSDVATRLVEQRALGLLRKL